MSDDEIENEDEADKKNLIGVDPLAWLSDEEKQSVLNEAAVASKEEGAFDNTQKTYSIDLRTALTISEAADFLNDLNEIDEQYDEIIFEAEKLERVDAAAIQLLLGFYLFATKAGKKVIWNKPSDTFCHAVGLLGLEDIIGIEPLAA